MCANANTCIHFVCVQVLLLFWASRPFGLPQPLAFVRYYTTEGCGRLDGTGMERVCFEKEKRNVQTGPRTVVSAMVAKTDVVKVSDIIKSEHIVPFEELGPGDKQLYYVNKYASFS